MNKKRYTTSWDESLGHACGQQSLCQVIDLVDVSFVTNELVFIFFCFLTQPERGGERQEKWDNDEETQDREPHYKPQHHEHKV